MEMQIERCQSNVLGTIDNCVHISTLIFSDLPLQLVAVCFDDLKVQFYRLAPCVCMEREQI